MKPSVRNNMARGPTALRTCVYAGCSFHIGIAGAGSDKARRDTGSLPDKDAVGTAQTALTIGKTALLGRHSRSAARHTPASSFGPLLPAEI